MESPPVPKIDYAQFAKRLNRQIDSSRIPINGSIELTFRCNLRCVHCYCNLSLNDQSAISKELKTKEVFQILDQIEEAGCLWLLITGGEPLVREDFFEIYEYAKRKGFIITLFTNGTLITPEIAKYFAGTPPFSVEITLYGVSKETYEKITGIPGSYKRCQEGIKLFLEHKVPLSLKTMLITLNYHEYFQIKEYAEKLGVGFRFDPLVNPRLNGSKRPCRFRLPPEDIVKVDLIYEKRINEWCKLYEESSALLQSDHLFICGGGVSTLHIDPYGQMSPCEMARFKPYDLRSGSFEEGWREYMPKLLNTKPAIDYPCSRCELISLCAQCPGWAWLENGDPEKPVEYLCRLAHLQAQSFQQYGTG